MCLLGKEMARGPLFLVLQLVRHDCPKEQSPDREKKAQVLGYALTKPALQSGTALPVTEGRTRGSEGQQHA